MSILKSLGYNITYKEPERLTADEARERRLHAALLRSRMELEARVEPLSRVNKEHLQRLKDFESKFSQRLEAARRATLTSRGPRDRKLAILGLSSLLQKRASLVAAADAERRRNLRIKERNSQRVAAVAASRKYYSPYLLNPRSTSGTEAATYVSALSRRVFKNPLTSVPCIQRMVRREVMFARRHAGVGHPGRRRHNPFSAIGC